jgi:hypothetical protein
MKPDLDGSTNPNTVGARKVYDLVYHATIFGNIGMLMELWNR